jgi:hypothetical protein
MNSKKMDNNINLDPTVWGPHYWFFLHTAVFTYPINPTDAVKKRYYELLHNFDMYIPHKKVASYYRHLLTIYPLKPYLDKKEDLVKWVWYIHNKVNDKLEKKRITLEEFYENYYAKYNTSEDIFKLKVAKYFVLALSIVIAICGLYFMYYYYERNR